MSDTKENTGRATARSRKNQTSAAKGKKVAAPTPVIRRIPMGDIKTARELRKYFESQIRPVTLLRRTIQLRDEIAARGPSEEREKKHVALIWPLIIYRIQANCDRMKAKHGVVSEALEYAHTRPLTETDLQRLKEVWKLNKEIGALMGFAARKRKKRAV